MIQKFFSDEFWAETLRIYEIFIPIRYTRISDYSDFVDITSTYKRALLITKHQTYVALKRYVDRLNNSHYK